MARWSLEIRVGGEPFTTDLDIDPSLRRGVMMDGSSPDPIEVPLTLVFPVDVAERAEQGVALDNIEGSLYLDGELILTGRAVDVEYGGPEAPPGLVSLTLRSGPLEDRALYPDAAAIVTAETWPDHDPVARNRVYPCPFGTRGAQLDTAGSPALLVAHSIGEVLVLVADGWTECDEVTLIVPHGGSTVTIGSDTVIQYPAYSEVYTIIKGYDSLLRRVSYVDLWEKLSLGLPTIPYAIGTEYHASWTHGAAFSGRLGDVVERMLRASSGSVDFDRLANAVGELNQYELAGYIDERCTPTDWIYDNLVPLASMGLLVSSDGLYPVAIPVVRTAEKAVAHLEAGPTCERVSSVRWDGEPLNELTFKYLGTSDAGDYLGTIVVDPSNNPYADASRRRYAGDAQNGVYADTIETDMVDSDDQAHVIAHEIVRRRWARERVVQYRTWPEIWGRIDGGQLVTITDADMHWTRRPALVIEREDDKDATLLTLSIDDDLFRDLR